MSKANKRKFFVLFLGFLTGLLLTSGTLFIAYKLYTKSKAPARFNAAEVADKFTKDDYRLFVASSLDRIFQDGWTLVKPAYSESARLSSAKNEYESFQVVVSAGQQELRDVRLDISDLIDEKSGGQINKSNISWRVVGYVPTKKPYYPVKYVGFWPDPLLPGVKTDIPAQTTQPFWVTVYTPKEVRAGTYTGTVTVLCAGRSPQQIPVSLTVYNFELPVESHLKTAFDFYGHITKNRYPQGDNESQETYAARINYLNEKYILEMLKYRLNPILNIDPSSPEDLGRIDRYRLYGINNFSIGKHGGTFNNNWPADDQAIDGLMPLYRSYGELLKLNKMLHYTYIYTWDEGDIGKPVVAKLCRMIHTAHPALKNMVCYHGFWDPQEFPGWGNEIDIWCFQIDNFNEKKMRALQERNMEIWMYASGPSGYTTPNLAIDFDSIDYRIIPWLSWKYDIKGFLYWCVNWWPLADPFKTAANTKWEQNGNGLLFYPGEAGPLASLRLEIFRDGLEDYEYIQQLMGRLKEIKKRKLDAGHESVIDEGIKVLTVDNSIAEAMDRYTHDTQTLMKRRDAIAQKIEEADRLLSSQTVAAAPDPVTHAP